MGIKDFEEAIDALNRGIEIDEIKLHHGQVCFVYGHMSSKLLLWDCIGLAYSLDLPFPADESVIQGLQDTLIHRVYAINPEFDLKFELPW